MSDEILVEVPYEGGPFDGYMYQSPFKGYPDLQIPSPGRNITQFKGDGTSYWWSDGYQYSEERNTYVWTGTWYHEVNLETEHFVLNLEVAP